MQGNKENKHNFSEDDFSYPKDFKYKPDIFGLVYFVFSMVSLYLSFKIYLLALPVSLILFVLSVLNHKKNRTISTDAAIVTGSLAFLISLFILLVNIIVY